MTDLPVEVNETKDLGSSRDQSQAASGASPRAEGQWRCANCAHWMPEPDYGHPDLTFGNCAAILQRETIIEPAREIHDWDAREKEEGRLLSLAKAIAVDGSGYYAAVSTAPDFGCVLFEPSPPNPSSPGLPDGGA